MTRARKVPTLAERAAQAASVVYGSHPPDDRDLERAILRELRAAVRAERDTTDAAIRLSAIEHELSGMHATARELERCADRIKRRPKP